MKICGKDVLNELFNSVQYQYRTKERVETALHRIQEMNGKLNRNAGDDNELGEANKQKIQEAYDLLKNIIQENSMALEYIDEHGDEINELLNLIPASRLQQLFKSSTQLIGTFGFQAYFDLILVLAVYQSDEQLKQLFSEYIEPTLRNAKKGGVTPTIKERQAKSYEMLRNILQSQNVGCQRFVATHLLEIQKTLLNTLQNRKDTSQDIRLT